MKPQAAPVEYTEAQVLDMLRQVVRSKQKTQQALATDAGVSRQYICDVLAGRRSVGEKISAAIGLTPVLVFRPLRNAAPRGTL